MILVPVTLREANRFIDVHHRHNVPLKFWKFGVGVEIDAELVGVAIAGLPVSPILAEDRFLLEVRRTCTAGAPNVNSKLYGAVARAAKALGYRRLITYTQEGESGSSLKACGWVIEGEYEARKNTWYRPNHPDRALPPQEDLFGNVRRPEGKKIRWGKDLW